MAKRKKRALTLLEIMIVIALIGIIGGVVGVNMKKSLEKAKIFQTKTAKQQLEDLLNLELANGEINPGKFNGADSHATLVKFIQKNAFVKDPKKLAEDAWNKPFIVIYDSDDEQFQVSFTKTSPAFKLIPAQPREK